MRITTFVSLLGAAALAAVAGCVKDVDQPALAGPSTFAHSIIMVADRDTLLQNGVDFTDIRITSLSPNGTSENIQLRAQIYVDGVPNDYGALSTKSPITPATIRYTAPPASLVTTAQVATTVTIAVTLASGGDFRGENTRVIDINLQPVGIIIPTNPTLTAAFTFQPAAPKVLDIVAFDASTSTNGGTACLTLCNYAWDFGDGTTANGMNVTHEFRKTSIFQVKLTVTDQRGSTASKLISLTVAPGTPPTVDTFTFRPDPPPSNVDIFFDGTSAKAATGRTIVSYSWDFGDGGSAGGPIATHKFTGIGKYVVTLTVTDDAGSVKSSPPKTLDVGGAGSEPIAKFETTITGRTLTVNASTSTPGTTASIVNYKFDYGDGNFENVPNPIQSHTYVVPGTFIVLLEVTDSNGKKATFFKQVVIP